MWHLLLILTMRYLIIKIQPTFLIPCFLFPIRVLEPCQHRVITLCCCNPQSTLILSSASQKINFTWIKLHPGCRTRRGLHRRPLVDTEKDDLCSQRCPVTHTHTHRQTSLKTSNLTVNLAQLLFCTLIFGAPLKLAFTGFAYSKISPVWCLPPLFPRGDK